MQKVRFQREEWWLTPAEFEAGVRAYFEEAGLANIRLNIWFDEYENGLFPKVTVMGRVQLPERLSDLVLNPLAGEEIGLTYDVLEDDLAGDVLARFFGTLPDGWEVAFVQESPSSVSVAAVWTTKVPLGVE